MPLTHTRAKHSQQSSIKPHPEESEISFETDDFVDIDSLPLPSFSLLAETLDSRAKSGAFGMQGPASIAQPLQQDNHIQSTNPESSFPNLTHKELLDTAEELYRRMEDPQFASDDAYWTSLPIHLRNFIRNALPLAGGVAGIGNGSGILPGGANAAGGQRAMYHLAQQVVNAANQGLGSMGQPLSEGYDQAGLPLVNGMSGALSTDHDLQGNHHMNGGDQYYAEESDNGSEDSVNNLAMDSLSISNVVDGGDGGKKKKKKKKKGGQDIAMDHTVPPQQTLHPLPTPQSKPVSQPPLAQLPPAPVHTAPIPTAAPQQQQQFPSAKTAPPPSAQAKPNGTPQQPTSAVPPSSRAAGKQPMAYVPANTGSTNPPPQNNGNPPARSARSAGKAPVSSAPGHTHSHNHAGHSHPPQTALAKTTPVAGGSKSKPAAPAQPPRVWQTSTSEERERIKEFWLDLNQDERQTLVTLEKDAVLKRMKEQQRHSCACAVCGRKRSAIEDELEVLYDSYYDELEAYAHHQAQYQSTQGAIPPPLGPGPFPGSVEMDSSGHVVRPDHLAPTSRNEHRRKGDGAETEDDDEYDDEEYDDDDVGDDEEDAGSDEADNGDDDYEESQDRPNGNRKSAPPAARKVDRAPSKAADTGDGTGSDGGDFFTFGSSLTTVKGILTVADDLMKNDGERFMEMMEQLAERRMLREDAAVHAIEEDLDEAGEADEDLDDDLDEEDDEDEEDEDERMEEGRRMFQIFAARMFEQRVLQSYREKVAQQKQLQFLRELEEEENAAEAREARKAKEAQKKKDKKRLQKEAKDAEKAKKDADTAAAAAALKAKQELLEKEAAKRREEERLRKEADRKAKVEEAQKREEDKRKRAAEEREKELELVRKKKEKEDRLKAEKEAKERERKVQEEKDRQAKEAKEKEDKEAKERSAAELAAKKEAAKREKEEREQRERDALVAAQAQAQAKLLSQQKAAAAKAAVIAQQQAKAQKPSRAPAPAPAPTPKAKSMKAGAPAFINGVSSGVQSHPISSTPPVQESRSPAPTPAALMPTPNLKATATTRPSPTPAAATTSAQVTPQIGFTPLAPIAHTAAPTAPIFSNRTSYNSSAVPQFGSAPGPIGSTTHPSLQTSFVAQGATLAPGRGSAASSSGMFPNAPYSQSTMASSPAYSPGALSTPGSAAPRSFGSDLPDVNGRPGLGQLGIGHPGKVGRVGEESPFLSPGVLAAPGSSRSLLDTDLSAPVGHSFQSGPPRRPEPIGPIQPIGRPRLGPDPNEILEEVLPSGSSSRRSSPPVADRILGSAALGGDDDEVIVPAPRRVSNTAAMGSSWGNPGSLSAGASWGASAFTSPSSGIWGGGNAASAWPGSSNFGPPARFEPKMSAAPGAIGGFPSPQPQSRGFPSGSIGHPGGAIRPPSSQHDGR